MTSCSPGTLAMKTFSELMPRPNGIYIYVMLCSLCAIVSEHFFHLILILSGFNVMSCAVQEHVYVCVREIMLCWPNRTHNCCSELKFGLNRKLRSTISFDCLQYLMMIINMNVLKVNLSNLYSIESIFFVYYMLKV